MKKAMIDIDGVLNYYPQTQLDFYNDKYCKNKKEYVTSLNELKAKVSYSKYKEIKSEYRISSYKHFATVRKGAKQLLDYLEKNDYLIYNGYFYTTANNAARTETAGDHTHTKGTMRITGSAPANSEAFSTGGTGALYATRATGRRNRDGDSDNRVTQINLDTNSGGWTGATSQSGSHTHTVTVGNTGDGQAVNILNPYLAVNKWQRIA